MVYSKQKFVDYFDSGKRCVKLVYNEKIGLIEHPRNVKANLQSLDDDGIDVIITKLLRGENEGVAVGDDVQIPYDCIKSHEFCAKGYRDNS